jgi:hypothetical protein
MVNIIVILLFGFFFARTWSRNIASAVHRRRESRVSALSDKGIQSAGTI